MFQTSTSTFDKLLDEATSNLADWPTILQICDLVRQDDVQPKYALAGIKKKLFSTNPHTALFALQVVESLVKNCGNIIHEELTLKVNCEMLHELAKTTQYENVRQKLLELIQTWTFAFRNNPKHNALRETMNLMKAEGYKFPTLRESDAMFTANSAPEWADGEVCHRCRSPFGIVQRKHHCRNCGQVFCSQCSQKTAGLPKYVIEREVRVCDACYDQVTKPPLSSAATKKSAGVKQEESDLPAEYLSSSLAQENQMPPRKTEEELREEEELHLALALSQSEAEAKEKEKFRATSLLHSTVKYASVQDEENEEGNKEGEESEQTEQPVQDTGRSDAPLCIICKDNAPTTVLLPCAHFGLCDDCSAEMQARHKAKGVNDGVSMDYSVCPLDRVHIEQYVRLVGT